jgi:YHS domain-containing protein
MVNLLRLVVLFLVIYFLYKIFKGFFLSSDTKAGKPTIGESLVKGEDLVQDPYCHRYLPMSQAYRQTIEGEDVFFCSRECCEQYKAHKDSSKDRRNI